MLTRSALGQYQKANRLKVDCWPTAAVLDHMRMRPAAATELEARKPGGACAPPGRIRSIRASGYCHAISRRDVARADLHRLAGVADDAAEAVIDRLGGPVAAGVVDRPAIAFVDHIAARARSDDCAGDDGAANDAGGDAGAPAPAAPALARLGRKRPACRMVAAATRQSVSFHVSPAGRSATQREMQPGESALGPDKAANCGILKSDAQL